MEEYEEPEPKGKLILKVGRLVIFDNLIKSVMHVIDSVMRLLIH